MRNTQVVRNTIRDLNINEWGTVYMNKHEKCRTIKINCSNRDGANAVQQVRDALPPNLDATVKFIPSTVGRDWGGESKTGSLIVRLPITY